MPCGSPTPPEGRTYFERSNLRCVNTSTVQCSELTGVRCSRRYHHEVLYSLFYGVSHSRGRSRGPEVRNGVISIPA